MKAIFMSAKNYSVPQMKTYENFDGMMGDLGLKKDSKGTYPTFETMLLNEDDPLFSGIGIIAHDQDKGRKKMNILGIKGDFIIVGMKRLEPGTPANPHMFDSLTDDQVSMVRRKLTLTILTSNR